MWARVKALSPRVVLALGLIIPLLYAFPGMMSQDSFDLLAEARTGIYSDQHPPFNAWLWRHVDMVLPGAFGMIVLQLVAFQIGLFLILRRTFSPRAAAWIAAGVVMWPPILAPMGVVWKDCFMAGMLALGAGLLVTDQRPWRMIGLVALVAATACRYNAFPGVFPVVVLTFQWRDGMRWLHRLTIALAVWIAVTAVAFGLNTALKDRQNYFWHSTLAVFDIAGVLVHLEPLPDSEMEKLLAGTQPQIHTDMDAALRALYSPRDFIQLTSPEGKPMWNLPLYGDPAPVEVRTAIEVLWKKLVFGHPRAYLEHRFGVMRELLCLGNEAKPVGAIPRRAPATPTMANNLQLNRGWSRLQKKMSRVLYAIWQTVPIFAPWMYLVISLVMLWFARRQLDTLALIASGLLVEGTLSVLAMSSDYRYSHWLIVTTCVSTIILIKRRQDRVAAMTQQSLASHASTQ